MAYYGETVAMAPGETYDFICDITFAQYTPNDVDWLMITSVDTSYLHPLAVTALYPYADKPGSVIVGLCNVSQTATIYIHSINESAPSVQYSSQVSGAVLMSLKSTV